LILSVRQLISVNPRAPVMIVGAVVGFGRALGRWSARRSTSRSMTTRPFATARRLTIFGD